MQKHHGKHHNGSCRRIPTTTNSSTAQFITAILVEDFIVWHMIIVTMTCRGFGVLIGVLVAGPISGAHLNPAVRSPVIFNIIINIIGKAIMADLIIRIILTIINIRLFHLYHPWLSDPIQHCSCCRGQIWLEEGANKYISLSQQIIYLSGQIFSFEWRKVLTNILTCRCQLFFNLEI